MSQRYILVLDLQLEATESDDGKRKVQSHETSLSKQMHRVRQADRVDGSRVSPVSMT